LLVVVPLRLVLAATVAAPGCAAAVAAIAVHGGEGGARRPPACIQLLSQRRPRQYRACRRAQLQIRQQHGSSTACQDCMYTACQTGSSAAGQHAWAAGNRTTSHMQYTLVKQTNQTPIHCV
jgi:hypothetical protein